MNMETGEIRPWDSLSDAEQRSGQWLKLPVHDENGERVYAKRRTPFDDQQEATAPEAFRERTRRDVEHHDRFRSIWAGFKR